MITPPFYKSSLENWLNMKIFMPWSRGGVEGLKKKCLDLRMLKCTSIQTARSIRYCKCTNRSIQCNCWSFCDTNTCTFEYNVLAIHFNATFLFRSLLLVVNSSMKYQIYTKCIILWDPELKFSSSWSFFNTCVKYMYWYYKTRSIIQRNWNIAPIIQRNLNIAPIIQRNWNIAHIIQRNLNIARTFPSSRETARPFTPSREKTFSTWQKWPSDVPIAFNCVIKNKFTFTKHQASMLKFLMCFAGFDLTTIQHICKWQYITVNHMSLEYIYTLHFFHENLQENVECLIYRIHMYKSHVCRN